MDVLVKYVFEPRRTCPNYWWKKVIAAYYRFKKKKKKSWELLLFQKKVPTAIKFGGGGRAVMP